MSSLPNQPDHRGDPDLPDALGADLRALYARDVRVPPSLDASILADARAGFAKRRRFRLALRGALVASGAAAAALAVLALRLTGPGANDAQGPIAQEQATSPAVPVAVAARVEDVDRSGQVDILDAFVVAKLVDLQSHLDHPAYDVNRDGKVDRADVDRIATAAVATTPASGAEGRVQ